MSHEQKDFSSVSPSAKSLLLMKGHTSIPYARQTAALMQGPEVFEFNFDDKDFWFWIRVMHFENRYRSIDELMHEAGNKNVLELSSGYSLRGVDLCVNDANAHYIDTDLAEVVAVKQSMIDELQLRNDIRGKYELLPLNVLNEVEFNAIADRFDNGALTIVNEGLLMYLNTEEKKQLCKTIHRTLKERGGCWITADIYVTRTAEMRAKMPQSRGEIAFLEQHNVEENKFESYEAAQLFFKEQGFELVKEFVPDLGNLSVMPQLIKALPEEMRASKQPPPKIQATWMLKAV